MASAALSFTQLVGLGMSIGWWCIPRITATVLVRLFYIVFPSTMVFVSAVYLLLFTLCMFLLGAPRRFITNQLKPWRVVLLFAGCICLISGALFVIMSIALQWQYFGQWPIYSVWESTIGMALVASAAATLAYARQLALFIRSTRIAYFSEWLLLIPGLMVVFALPIVGQVFLRNVGRIIPYAAFCYLVSSGLLFAALSIAFRRRSRESRDLWITESAPAYES
jgi:hypothetical protein